MKHRQGIVSAMLAASLGTLAGLPPSGSGAAVVTYASEVNLPDNWRNLKNSEKFAALRNSSRLVRGSLLQNVEVDCRKGNITDRNAHLGLNINYPGRETGSFIFRDRDGRAVTGRLEVLSSDARRYDRIFVLSHPMTSENGRGVPRVLSSEELADIASLLETHQNRCVETHGHHIEAFVILAKRER